MHHIIIRFFNVRNTFAWVSGGDVLPYRDNRLSQGHFTKYCTWMLDTTSLLLFL